MRPMRVFLVEDNPADVWLIEECLRRRSIASAMEQYSTAEDAVQALAIAGGVAGIPDLMLIDFNLPCGHGLSVLEAAARNPALEMVPKAILSSFLTPEESARAGALGVRVVVQKPSSLEGFMQEVGGAIEELLLAA
jgi:CheY-like chemotaxis protein